MNIPLFHTLSSEDRKRLASSIRRQSIKKGEILFRKGSEGTTLYVIIQGKIKIALPSMLGDEVVLALFSDGDFFGEMALLDGMPRSADAIALEDSELYVLNQSDFVAFLNSNTDAIQAILRSLSQRLRKTDDLLQDTCFLNVSGRFAKKLLELAEENGRKVGDEIEFDIALTQTDLAKMVGASRESINKELRTLREKGLVSVQGNTICIHNLTRLKRRIK
jgi:CRP-like cAMP-binding protein